MNSSHIKSILKILILLFLTVSFLMVAPAYVTAANPVRFVVTGDSRNDSTDPGGQDPNGVNDVILEEMALYINNHENADFIIFTGDLVFGPGEGMNSIENQLRHWKGIMDAALINIPVYPVRGNHDAGDLEAWQKVFILPPNGPPNEKEITYSFTQENVFIVGLDQYGDPDYTIDQDWLNAQFNQNNKPHVFVFGHAPAFKVRQSGILDVFPVDRDIFWNSLGREGGRTYFCGHDHFYNHARLDNENNISDDDLHQLVVGTAGAPLKPRNGGYNGLNRGWNPLEVKHEKQYGYVLVEIDGPNAKLTWKHRTAPGVYESEGDVFEYTVPNWVAYNDLDPRAPGGDGPENPPKVTEHDYGVTGGKLKNFSTGDDLDVTITGESNNLFQATTGDNFNDVWQSSLWYQNGDTLGWEKEYSPCPVRLTAGDVSGDGRAEIIGIWDSGIYNWNPATDSWTELTSWVTTGDMAAGDITGDGKADVASCWLGYKNTYGLYYQNGATRAWQRITTYIPYNVAVGDITGDGNAEVIGTFASGIWYWNPITNRWTRMTSWVTTKDIAAGDITGDGKADVASCWPGKGLWYQNGNSFGWQRITTYVPYNIAVGDITGDGNAEVIGAFASGIWYWNPVTDSWTIMTSYVTDRDIAAGDFTGDGKADVASCRDNGFADGGYFFGTPYDRIVDLRGISELGVADSRGRVTLNNLDPTKAYNITLTANRDKSAYQNQRYTRVTIEGGNDYQNESSQGVSINSNASVSFSTGYNTENGYVARWVNIRPGSDGSFSIKSEWDQSQDGPKGYAMSAFRLEEFNPPRQD